MNAGRRLGVALMLAATLSLTTGWLGTPATATPLTMFADFSTAPVMEPIPDQTVDELSQMTVNVHADDPDLPNDVLRFSLSGGPVGASISPGGRITWTPAESDGPGVFTITARVEDASGAADQKSFRVTVVEVNSAPGIGSIPDQALGSADEMDVAVTVADSDEPANSFTFGAEGLPPGVTIDADTGHITGTVTASEAGTSGVAVVTVTDDGSPPMTASRTFSWLVTTGNRAPTMDPIDTQIVGSDGTVGFTAVANDGDPLDTLSYWLAEGIDPVPAGAVIDEQTGRFTWQPTEDQYDAVYQFNVGVSDSGSPRLSATQLVTVVLPEYNVPPEVTSILDQVSAEGDIVSLAVSASDSNVTDKLGYFAAGLPPGLELDTVTGVISGEISYDASVGSPYEVTITVTDDGTPEASGVVSFGWQVADTNRPPETSPISLVALVGSDVPIQLQATDPDGDLLTYTIVTAPTNGRLEGEPPTVVYMNVGGTSDQFTFSVSDGEFEVEAIVSIELRASNEPPEPEIDEYDVAVDGRLEVDAPGVLGNDSDPDHESLAAVLIASPDHGDLELSLDGSFVYSPTRGYVGADKFTYAAVDALGEQATATVAIDVVPPVSEQGPDTAPSADNGVRATIVAATAASWEQPHLNGGGVVSRMARSLSGAISSGISSVSNLGYPFLLLAAALVLALTVGKVSLFPTGSGRSQGEGTVDWYDARKGFGKLNPNDGGQEVYIHSGAIEEGFAPGPGRHVEFIAADIKGRRVALKVWAN
jgi:large repetitive protein